MKGCQFFLHQLSLTNIDKQETTSDSVTKLLVGSTSFSRQFYGNTSNSRNFSSEINFCVLAFITAVLLAMCVLRNQTVHLTPYIWSNSSQNMSKKTSLCKKNILTHDKIFYWICNMLKSSGYWHQKADTFLVWENRCRKE